MDSKDLAIVVTAAQSFTQEEIAGEIGMSQSTVSRRLSKPDVKALIEEIQISLIEDTAEKTKEIIKDLIHEYKANACLDKKSEIEKDHAFKCLTKIAEAIGVFPTHTGSSLIVNILNQQTPAETSKEVEDIKAFIHHKLQQRRDDNPNEYKT